MLCYETLWTELKKKRLFHVLKLPVSLFIFSLELTLLRLCLPNGLYNYTGFIFVITFYSYTKINLRPSALNVLCCQIEHYRASIDTIGCPLTAISHLILIALSARSKVITMVTLSSSVI